MEKRKPTSWYFPLNVPPIEEPTAIFEWDIRKHYAESPETQTLAVCTDGIRCYCLANGSSVLCHGHPEQTTPTLTLLRVDGRPARAAGLAYDRTTGSLVTYDLDSQSLVAYAVDARMESYESRRVDLSVDTQIQLAFWGRLGIPGARKVILVSSAFAHKVYAVPLTNGEPVFDLIGSGMPGAGKMGDLPARISLRSPRGLWVDPADGSVFVCDSLNHRIVRVFQDKADLHAEEFANTDTLLGVKTSIPVSIIRLGPFHGFGGDVWLLADQSMSGIYRITRPTTGPTDAKCVMGTRESANSFRDVSGIAFERPGALALGNNDLVVVPDEKTGRVFMIRPPVPSRRRKTARDGITSIPT